MKKFSVQNFSERELREKNRRRLVLRSESLGNLRHQPRQLARMVHAQCTMRRFMAVVVVGEVDDLHASIQSCLYTDDGIIDHHAM